MTISFEYIPIFFIHEIQLFPNYYLIIDAKTSIKCVGKEDMTNLLSIKRGIKKFGTTHGKGLPVTISYEYIPVRSSYFLRISGEKRDNKV